MLKKIWWCWKNKAFGYSCVFCNSWVNDWLIKYGVCSSKFYVTVNQPLQRKCIKYNHI